MIEETTAVVSNEAPMPGARLLQLEAPGIAKEARPGQFVMVHCGDKGKYPLRRPLSIHNREGDRIALLFNIVGGGTQWLSELKPDDEISLLGPLGNGFDIHQGSKKLLLVAGGMGIAPLVFLAKAAVAKGLAVTLLYGAQNAAQLYSTLPKVKVVTATEDGSVGIKGMIIDLLPDCIEEADQSFACGPLPMYKAMSKMTSLKDKAVQVSLEVRMGCGVGVCYGCTVKTQNGLKQVCKDGPVFELNDIVWEEMRD